MSDGRVFIDTNVFIYAFSPADRAKFARAGRLLDEQAGNIIVSTQVVQEFYAAGLRKLKLPRRKLKDAVHTLLDLPLVVVSGEHIRSAIEFEERYQVSFWDGLILAAATSAKADTLFTEDLNDGQRYGTVTARNPFA